VVYALLQDLTVAESVKPRRCSRRRRTSSRTACAPWRS